MAKCQTLKANYEQRIQNSERSKAQFFPPRRYLVEEKNTSITIWDQMRSTQLMWYKKWVREVLILINFDQRTGDFMEMEVKIDLKGQIQEELPLYEHTQKIQGKENRDNTKKKKNRESPFLF